MEGQRQISSNERETGALVAYLDGERAEGNADVSVDVLALASEDRVLGRGEDMVLVPAAVAVARDRVVDHQPLVHVYNRARLVLAWPVAKLRLTDHRGACHWRNKTSCLEREQTMISREKAYQTARRSRKWVWWA